MDWNVIKASTYKKKRRLDMNIESKFINLHLKRVTLILFCDWLYCYFIKYVHILSFCQIKYFSLVRTLLNISTNYNVRFSWPSFKKGSINLKRWMLDRERENNLILMIHYGLSRNCNHRLKSFWIISFNQPLQLCGIRQD